MHVRNISDAARFIASSTHDFFSDGVEPDETVEVPDELGASLCEQVDIWEPAETPPPESAKERKAREKAEAEAAEQAAAEAAAAADKEGA